MEKIRVLGGCQAEAAVCGSGVCSYQQIGAQEARPGRIRNAGSSSTVTTQLYRFGWIGFNRLSVRTSVCGNRIPRGDGRYLGRLVGRAMPHTPGLETAGTGTTQPVSKMVPILHLRYSCP